MAYTKKCNCDDKRPVTTQPLPVLLLDPKKNVKLPQIFDKLDGLQILNHAHKFPLHPLLIASSIGHKSGVTKLISTKINVNLQSGKDDATAVHLAAAAGNREIVDILIMGGANLDIVTKDGYNPLMVAILSYKIETIRVIWKQRKKFNINSTDKLGNTALHLASTMNWCEMVQLLLNGGVDQYKRNKMQMTALGIAVEAENNGAAYHLLEQLVLTRNVEQYIKSEIQLLRQLKCGNEDDEKLMANTLLPTLSVICGNEFSRQCVNFTQLYRDIISISYKYLKKQATLYCLDEFIAFFFESMFEADRQTVKDSIVRTFISNRGPDLLLKVYMKFVTTHDLSEMYFCLSPFVPMLRTDHGKSWMSEHYNQLDAPMKTLNTSVTEVLNSDEADRHKGLLYCAGKSVLSQFKEAFGQLQVESNKHYKELLELEMAKQNQDVAKKTKKAKQKEKKLQGVNTDDTNTLEKQRYSGVQIIRKAQVQTDRESRHRTNYEEASFGLAYAPDKGDMNASFEKVLSKRERKKLKVVEKLKLAEKQAEERFSQSTAATVQHQIIEANTTDQTKHKKKDTVKQSVLTKVLHPAVVPDESVVLNNGTLTSATTTNGGDEEEDYSHLSKRTPDIKWGGPLKHKPTYLAALKKHLSSIGKNRNDVQDDITEIEAQDLNETVVSQNDMKEAEGNKFNNQWPSIYHSNKWVTQEKSDAECSEEGFFEKSLDETKEMMCLEKAESKHQLNIQDQSRFTVDCNKDEMSCNENNSSKYKGKMKSKTTKWVSQIKAPTSVKYSSSSNLNLCHGKFNQKNTIQEQLHYECSPPSLQLTDNLFSAKQSKKLPLKETDLVGEQLSKSTDRKVDDAITRITSKPISPLDPIMKNHPDYISSSIFAKHINCSPPSLKLTDNLYSEKQSNKLHMKETDLFEEQVSKSTKRKVGDAITRITSKPISPLDPIMKNHPDYISSSIFAKHINCSPPSLKLTDNLYSEKQSNKLHMKETDLFEEQVSKSTKRKVGDAITRITSKPISPLDPIMKNHPDYISSSIFAKHINCSPPSLKLTDNLYSEKQSNKLHMKETDLFEEQVSKSTKRKVGDAITLITSKSISPLDPIMKNHPDYISSSIFAKHIKQIKRKSSNDTSLMGPSNGICITKGPEIEENLVKTNDVLSVANEDSSVESVGLTKTKQTGLKKITDQYSRKFCDEHNIGSSLPDTQDFAENVKYGYVNCKQEEHFVVSPALFPINKGCENLTEYPDIQDLDKTVTLQTDTEVGSGTILLHDQTTAHTSKWTPSFIPKYSSKDIPLNLSDSDSREKKVSILCECFGLNDNNLLSAFIDQGHCGLFSPENVWPERKKTQLVDDIVSIPSQLESEITEHSPMVFEHPEKTSSDGTVSSVNKGLGVSWMNSQELKDSGFFEVADDFSRLIYLQWQLAGGDGVRHVKHWNPFTAEAYQQECRKHLGKRYEMMMQSHIKSVKAYQMKCKDKSSKHVQLKRADTILDHGDTAAQQTADKGGDKVSTTLQEDTNVKDDMKPNSDILSKGDFSSKHVIVSINNPVHDVQNGSTAHFELEESTQTISEEEDDTEEDRLLENLFEGVISRADRPNPLAYNEELPLWSKWHNVMQDLFRLLPPFVYHVRNIMIPKYPDRFRIGAGPRGTMVCLGYTSCEKTVAVKRIQRTRMTPVRKQLQQLQWEELSHPNILPLLFSVEDCTYQYTVTSVCECNLSSYLFSLSVYSHAYDPFITRRLSHQILHGVAYLHSHQIVHGNLKPENVLLDCFGSVRLADYGLWDQDSCTAAPYKIHRTWTATEMLNPNSGGPKGYEALAAADMQVCGMLIYFTLTRGTHPYRDDQTETEVNICLGKPNLYPICPEPDDLIQNLLMVDPQARATAQAALCHPFFWEHDCRLVFVQQASVLASIIKAPAKLHSSAMEELLNCLDTVLSSGATLQNLNSNVQERVKETTGRDVHSQRSLLALLECIYNTNQENTREKGTLEETIAYFPLLPLEIFKIIRHLFPGALQNVTASTRGLTLQSEKILS